MFDISEATIIGEPVLVSGQDEYFRVGLHSILMDRTNVSTVLETATFDDSITCLSTHPEIALAIYSLDMPGMDNWANLCTIRHLFPNLRVVVMSASQDRNDILKCLESGVHGYISKTLSVDDLILALRQICNGMVYIPPTFPDQPVPLNSSARLADGESGALKHPRVTPRQKQIIELLVAGKSNKLMARELGLSAGTVKFHMSSVFRLLNASNRVQAATAGAQLLKEIAAESFQA